MDAASEVRHFDGANPWPDFLAWLDQGGFSRIVLLADTHTARHCLPRVLPRLSLPDPPLIVPAGEAFKSLDTARDLWERLLYLGADRRALLLNLGGGVITDLGGFVAATYKRGIAFVHIPTSLLAQVDAAIGGKTGVDLGYGKNLVGTFTDPAAVLIDPGFLETLPGDEWRSGLAEMIKHGVIGDTDLFARLETLPDAGALTPEDIRRAAAFKRKVVLADPFERGLRRILNFGHTFGHALESLALERGAPIRHGDAVAAGMRLEAWLSMELAGLPQGDLDRLRILLDRHFPRLHPDLFDPEALMPYLLMDKKNRDGGIGLVLLERPGTAHPDGWIGVPEIREALEAWHRSEA